jgi:hypothetical protein
LKPIDRGRSLSFESGFKFWEESVFAFAPNSEMGGVSFDFAAVRIGGGSKSVIWGGQNPVLAPKSKKGPKRSKKGRF